MLFEYVPLSTMVSGASAIKIVSSGTSSKPDAATTVLSCGLVSAEGLLLQGHPGAKSTARQPVT